jgi:hypothetical protein
MNRVDQRQKNFQKNFRFFCRQGDFARIEVDCRGDSFRVDGEWTRRVIASERCLEGFES